MTAFLQHYTLKYTPLSPVHIGADESYEPGNYVIDDEAGALYGFDSDASIKGLSEAEKKQLLAIVNGKPDDTMLTKVQAFFHHHQEKLVAFARPPLPTASGVKALYEKRIGKVAQVESQGKRVINKLEIDRTFYNPVDGNPLLPGSSIKGAIRTALLDSLNDQKDRKERNQQLQERLFDGKFHTDPMRLVALGDASWQGLKDRPTCQVTFAVNRKRKPVYKNGQLVQSQAEASNLYQLLESVNPQYQSFVGSLTLHAPKTIVKDRLKLPTKEFSIKEITNACNSFYVNLFQEEIKDLKERNYLHSDWAKQVEQILGDGLLKKLASGRAFLLRLGRHSGAEGLTLNGIRSIKIMQGRGEKPKYEKAPLTWWLAADNTQAKTNLLPFGWVLVEIDPKEPNTQLQQWLETNSRNDSAWLQTQLEKQNKLRVHIDNRIRLEQEKYQAELEREQELHQQQQAEQQRLTALSPIEQDIEAFLKSIVPQEHDTRLLQELESGRWQNEDAKLVAQKVKALMEKVEKWMPDYPGDNKQKVKLRDRSRRVQKYLS